MSSRPWATTRVEGGVAAWTAAESAVSTSKDSSFFGHVQSLKKMLF